MACSELKEFDPSHKAILTDEPQCPEIDFQRPGQIIGVTKIQGSLMTVFTDSLTDEQSQNMLDFFKVEVVRVFGNVPQEMKSQSIDAARCF